MDEGRIFMLDGDTLECVETQARQGRGARGTDFGQRQSGKLKFALEDVKRGGAPQVTLSST